MRKPRRVTVEHTGKIPTQAREILFEEALVRMVEEFRKQSVPGAIGVVWVHPTEHDAMYCIAPPEHFERTVRELYGEPRPDIVERLNSRPPEGKNWLLGRHRNGVVGLATFRVDRVGDVEVGLPVGSRVGGSE